MLHLMRRSAPFCPSCGFPIGKLAANPDDPLVGRTLPGGYLILELIGVGGMGRVYRAEQTTLGRTVAVKIIHPHLVGEENAAARFITEARAASRLNHPNSVGDHRLRQDRRRPALPRHGVPAGSRSRPRHLRGRRRSPSGGSSTCSGRRSRRSPRRTSENIIHRDLKPENIILEPVRSGGDFVKVVDFGLAKMRVETQAPGITSPGIVCGTPEYMSPEQARGDPLDARSDLYSVGVILYQLLTGRLPFEAESPTQVVLMHLTVPPPDPRDGRARPPDSQGPRRMSSLKALAKDAEGPLPGRRRVLGRARDRARAHRGARRRPRGAAASVRCTVVRRAEPRRRRSSAANAAQPRASRRGADRSAPRRRDRAAARRSAKRRTTERPSSSVPRASRRQRALPVAAAVRRPERGPRVARDASQRARGRSSRRAHRRRRRASARRAWSASSSTFAAAAGDVVVQAGPDPAWAEVGCWALRARDRPARGACRTTGGGQRDWVRRHAGGPARASRTSSARPARPRSGGLSPDERRFAAAEALRWAFVARERAGARPPRRPRRRRPALRRRREPQRLRRRAERSAARPGAPHRHVRSRASTPDGPDDVAEARVLGACRPPTW